MILHDMLPAPVTDRRLNGNRELHAMADVVVNGVKLNYRQTGAGPDLVLVHGLAANQAFWNLSLVAELAEEFRVTTFDLRGHGYSAMPATGYQPAHIAGDLRGLLDHLGINRAHLVGHSFGGLVILQLARAEPQRVASLTVADTRLRSLQPKQGVTQTAEWPAQRALLAEHGIVLDEDELDHSLDLFEAFASLGWDKYSQAGSRLAGGGPRSARRWLQLLANSTMREDFRTGGDIPREQLAEVRAPLLAVYGDQSPARKSGEQLAAWVPECRLVFVPHARHFHPATHPRDFLATLQTFLRNQKICA